MKQLVLSSRAYGLYKQKLVRTFISEIKSISKDLDVEKKVSTNRRDHLTIKINGADEQFFANVISREYGLVPIIENISPGHEYSGQLVDIGKIGYGIYVDIGISIGKTDALIPLHRLRQQIKLPKSAIKTISNIFVLVDNLPVTIRIVDVNRTTNKIEAELADSFLERLQDWSEDDHERLLVFGANRYMIEKALKKSGHFEDIYRIETLGLFEYSLMCKRSTRATGIIAAIGPKLKGVPMHLFIPKEIEEKQNAKT